MSVLPVVSRKRSYIGNDSPEPKRIKHKSPSSELTESFKGKLQLHLVSSSIDTLANKVSKILSRDVEQKVANFFERFMAIQKNNFPNQNTSELIVEGESIQASLKTLLHQDDLRSFELSQQLMTEGASLFQESKKLQGEDKQAKLLNAQKMIDASLALDEQPYALMLSGKIALHQAKLYHNQFSNNECYSEAKLTEIILRSKELFTRASQQKHDYATAYKNLGVMYLFQTEQDFEYDEFCDEDPLLNSLESAKEMLETHLKYCISASTHRYLADAYLQKIFLIEGLSPDEISQNLTHAKSYLETSLRIQPQHTYAHNFLKIVQDMLESDDFDTLLWQKLKIDNHR